MRRPPRPVQIPKLPDRTHERRASLRMVLVAGAVSALILSGNMSRAQAEADAEDQAAPAEVASSVVPVQLSAWSVVGTQSCEQSWLAVEDPLKDCLYQWWLVEPERESVVLDWQSGALGGSTLGVSDLPPPAVQLCMRDALGAAAPQSACAAERVLSMPPAD